MLDKNDRKYIIRRIITYISIAFIMVLLNLFCPLFKAKALTYGNIYGTKTTSPSNNSWNGLFEGSGQIGLSIMRHEIPNTFSVDCETDYCIFTFAGMFGSSQQGPTYNYTTDTLSIINQVYTGSWNVCETTGGLISCPVLNHSVVSIIETKYPRYFTSYPYYIDMNYITIYNSAGGEATAINEVNNSINSTDSPSNNEISGNANDWNSNNAQSGVINQLVLMPITLLNSFVNGINGSCSPYDFGELWGEHIIFPCINLSQTLGSVWTIIDVILSGIFIFMFGKRCVKIFNDFTNLRSGQIDTLYGGDN